MNANNIFSFKRFGKYFVSDLKTAAANFGLSLLTTPFIFLAMFLIFNVFIAFISGIGWTGPNLGVRIMGLILSLVITCLVMPSKVYGKITEKQYGSFWLMTPASTLEKSTSMILISCIIAPVLTICLYLGIDAILCAIDPSCGSNIISSLFKAGSEGIEMINTILGSGDEIPEQIASFLISVINPWMYLGEFLGLVLPFLFGAVFFKKNKVVYTILMLAAIGMASSFILSPIMIHSMENLVATNDPFAVFEHPVFKNLRLINFISNIVTDLVFMVLIYFRIKTLKH